jgi:hypothetical protein
MASNSEEFLSTLLSTTREQLTKAVNLCAELEALLIIEQKKTSHLETMLEQQAAQASQAAKSND